MPSSPLLPKKKELVAETGRWIDVPIRHQIKIFGENYHPDAVYGYSLTISFFIVVLLSPFLSSLADTIGNKKSFLQFFCYLGATSCMGLAMFTGMNNVFLGLLFSITASVGFWGSLVFIIHFFRILPRKTNKMRFLQKGMFMAISVLLFW